MSEAIPRALRERVAEEARHRCGYCLTDQGVSGAQMHIEPIVPRARGGRTLRSNLWLSCAWCNSFKGTRIAAPDPATGVEVALFNPREQDWSQHFRCTERTGGTYRGLLRPAGGAGHGPV
jgi:5-methylcytosine-specific restriction endonuclease McrA